MAAGQGFKTFATGDVLSASDVNGYLMQGVLVFADATERNAEITSPQEGQFAYLKDTNVTTYYTGSAWANLDTTGMTNPMTTTGDTIYSSSGSTPARLGIGSTGQVLTVAGGVPSWATPAGGGGKILQVVGAQLTTQVASSSSTFADTGLTGTITPSATSSKILVFVSCVVNKSAGNALNRVALRLLRGATTIVNITGGANVNDHYGLFTNTAEIGNGGYSTGYVDSPNTTSATTYKIQFANPNNSASIEMNPGNGTSSLVLMEIGA